MAPDQHCHDVTTSETFHGAEPSLWRCDGCGTERTTDLTGFRHAGCPAGPNAHFQPVIP